MGIHSRVQIPPGQVGNPLTWRRLDARRAEGESLKPTDTWPSQDNNHLVFNPFGRQLGHINLTGGHFVGLAKRRVLFSQSRIQPQVGQMPTAEDVSRKLLRH